MSVPTTGDVDIDNVPHRRGDENCYTCGRPFPCRDWPGWVEDEPFDDWGD